jgi:hypothetical protein
MKGHEQAAFRACGRRVRMFDIRQLYGLKRAARGISSTASIVIAVAVVLLFSGTILLILRTAMNLLWVAIEIGVLILVVLVVAYLIRVMSKKVSS